MKLSTDENGVSTGRVKGLKVSDGVRHVVKIQDYTGADDEMVPSKHKVWVGASTEGDPFLGAYVTKENFLKMVSGVFGVYIEDLNDKNDIKWWDKGEQYPQ